MNLWHDDEIIDLLLMLGLHKLNNMYWRHGNTYISHGTFKYLKLRVMDDAMKIILHLWIKCFCCYIFGVAVHVLFCIRNHQPWKLAVIFHSINITTRLPFLINALLVLGYFELCAECTVLALHDTSQALTVHWLKSASCNLALPRSNSLLEIQNHPQAYYLSRLLYFLFLISAFSDIPKSSGSGYANFCNFRSRFAKTGADRLNPTTAAILLQISIMP